MIVNRAAAVRTDCLSVLNVLTEISLWLQVTSASSSPEKCLTCMRALQLTRTGTLRFSTSQMLSMVSRLEHINSQRRQLRLVVTVDAVFTVLPVMTSCLSLH